MAPLLKEAACCADALRGAESSELARGWRCAVFYKQEGGVVTCAAGEILPPGVHDQVEDACVRQIVGSKKAHKPVTGKRAARSGDGFVMPSECTSQCDPAASGMVIALQAERRRCPKKPWRG